MTAYPRLACYGQQKGNGEPYLNIDGSLNDAMVRALSEDHSRAAMKEGNTP